jgi:hypothetical protein
VDLKDNNRKDHRIYISETDNCASVQAKGMEENFLLYLSQACDFPFFLFLK